MATLNEVKERKERLLKAPDIDGFDLIEIGEREGVLGVYGRNKLTGRVVELGFVGDELAYLRLSNWDIANITLVQETA